MICYFQILIAFYTQAMLNLILLISSGVVWLLCRKKKDLRHCLNNLKLDLATDWVAVGLAMTIAALSQWSTISIFHLYLSASFAITIPVEGFTQGDYIRWSRHPLRAIYFTAFRMSRIVLLIYFIYRFVRFWGNAPGQCFHLSTENPIPWLRFMHIPDDVNEKFVIMTMAFSNLLDILVCIVVIFLYLSGANVRDRVTQARKLHDIVTTVFGGFLVLLSSVSGIQVVLANRTQIIGDENTFSFGQVTALVTLVASFFKIGDSLHSKPCVPS